MDELLLATILIVFIIANKHIEKLKCTQLGTPYYPESNYMQMWIVDYSVSNIYLIVETFYFIIIHDILEVEICIDLPIP